MTRPFTLGLLFLACTAPPSAAETANDAVDERLRAIERPESVIRTDVGVTRQGTRIPALVTAADLDPRSEKTRILLVAGLDGSPKSVDAALELFASFTKDERFARQRERLAVSVVPVANPDGWFARRSDGDAQTRDLSQGWPPRGPFYSDEDRPEAAYLWRWVGLHAPDLVIEVADAKEPAIAATKSALDVLVERDFLQSGAVAAEAESFVGALSTKAPANVGAIPAVRVAVPTASDFPRSLLAELKELPPSPARVELRTRIARTPVETAKGLAEHYGDALRSVAYIPTVALIGRLQLGDVTGDDSHLADVRKIVAPYVTGEKDPLGENPSGVTFAGHLVFAELAKRTDDERYVELVRAAADFGFEDGKPREVMPGHHEMSDAVFMGGPIRAAAGKLTGERKYFDACARHVRFMLELNLREDGLHRHSPLDETAWGRGNGFPALGLALILSDFPEDHPDRPYLLKQFRSHMAALKRHQDPTGAWHQVVDRPESYREMSSTCMITFAMLRGMRNGWLDRAEYEPVVAKSWPAIQQRIAGDGTLVDVCTGTGKQQSLRDYYDRTAILGKDGRGGAMALLVATEMAKEMGR